MNVPGIVVYTFYSIGTVRACVPSIDQETKRYTFIDSCMIVAQASYLQLRLMVKQSRGYGFQ